MFGRLIRISFVICYAFSFLNCANEALRGGAETNSEGITPAIKWSLNAGTICEPGSSNRPALVKNTKKDVLEMIRMEGVDNKVESRINYMRNYYFTQGAWYHQSSTFGDGQDFGSPALVTGKNAGNLEIVVRRGNGLRHYWRDEATGIWHGGKIFGDNVKSDPALVCNIQNNNLEVVVRESNRLRHYWRDEASGNWYKDPEVFANDLAGSPSMIQTSDGNLHVVTKSKERQIHHYERVNSDGIFSWQYRDIFGYSVKGEPAMTINTDNNKLQVIVKEGVGTTGLKHYEYSGTWNQVSAIVSKYELHDPAVTTVQGHNLSVVCLDDPKNPCMISHFNYIQN